MIFEIFKLFFQQFDDAPLEEDAEKPVFSDDLDSDLDVENWDEYGVDDENPEKDFEANDDYTEEPLEDQDIPENETNDKEQMQKELIEASTSSKTGRKKSKKNKSKFADPVFNLNTRIFTTFRLGKIS